MTARLIYLTLVLCLVGCTTRVPTWSKADTEARNSGMFIPDDAYYASQQFKDEIQESATTVIRLRQQLGHDTAKTARVTLESSLSLQQRLTATNAATQQQAWEAQVYAASPNVTAKVTTMINPMDAKGRIMEQQILTYYDKGRMRYATNFFDLSK